MHEGIKRAIETGLVLAQLALQKRKRYMIQRYKMRNRPCRRGVLSTAGRKSGLITDVAVNIASRVDPPNHAIATRANIGKATRDLDPGIAIIACVRVDVAPAVDAPHIGFYPSRDPNEFTGNMEPVVAIPGITEDVAIGVHPPNRAIGTRANISKGTRDLDPGLGVITRVTIDVPSSVDSPDVG